MLNLYLTASVVAAGFPSPNHNSINIGPLSLRGYALTMLLGIIVASIIGTIRYTTRTWVFDKNRRLAEGESVYDRKFWNRPGAEDILDVVFWAVPFGIVGARLYHVISHFQDYFGPGRDWTSMFRVWEGGLAIIGAVAGGALGAWIACRRRGISFPVVVDALAPGLLVAQAIGRWGNWFNQELFGRPTTLPWGLQIDQMHLPTNPATGLQFPVGTLFHPTFLYESLWNLAMAGLLVLIDRRFRLGHGRVLLLYIYLYSLGRSWVEMMRIDSANVIGPLRVNSWAVMILGSLALIAFCLLGYRKPLREATNLRDDSTDLVVVP